MISFWIFNFMVLKICKWHNKINVPELRQRSSIKINFLVTSNGVLQYTSITQPSEERTLLQRLALISWCIQLNVLGQRFPEHHPGINTLWAGYGRSSGEERETPITSWDFCITNIILDHVCIYVKTCLPFREHDAEWDREGEKMMINIQLTGQRFRCNYFRLPRINTRTNGFVRKQWDYRPKTN